MHPDSATSSLLQSHQSKLTLPAGSTTVVGASLRALLNADVFDRIIVVVGHDAEAVEAAARDVLSPGDSVSFILNDCFAAGMSGSIALGAQTLSKATSGVAIGLGDLPTLHPDTVRTVADRLRHAPSDAVVRPTYSGQPGHPVLFGPTHHARLARLNASPDGARTLFSESGALTVAVRDPGVVRDIDTPSEYQALIAALSSG